MVLYRHRLAVLVERLRGSNCWRTIESRPVQSISTKEVMSAAKMVADSTQSDVTGDQQENKRKRHRRDKKSRKDSRKRRVSASPDSGSGEGGSASDEFDSDADLKKELKPLHAFLGDRTAFLDEMLRSVRGSSLQRALPAKLRDMPPEELRRRCLEQLQVMSRKRIKRIMAGDDPAVISSSSTEDEIIVWRGRERGRNKADDFVRITWTRRGTPETPSRSCEAAQAGLVWSYDQQIHPFSGYL
ncbi:uncharacterized protein LOC112573722 [Pomacea canaliculata]|uniref:uncharacterized protein LOC112573722 n=1 Tax=Pomacea canaliculata TaxID=400727 RepID=UPI000D734F55|nr:uncharacterized protein LOC112573722 [Pomacea canaliculata]